MTARKPPGRPRIAWKAPGTAKSKATVPNEPSALEALLAIQLRASVITGYVREFKFAPGRRWRFDFAWWNERLAVEVEGGTWSGGRHVRPGGFELDCEKYNRAVLLGWRVLRFTARQVQSGEAVSVIQQALSQRKFSHTTVASTT